MLVTSPEKRSEVLYARVSEQNKKYVERESQKLGVSEALFVDALIDDMRKKAKNGKSKTRGTTRKNKTR